MSTDPRMDRLHHVLKRALHRSELTKQVKKRLEENGDAKSVSDDYAKRLAEKHLYRRLLESDRQDAMRFRWYFTHINRSTPLDELRVWLDHKILEEDRRND